MIEQEEEKALSGLTSSVRYIAQEKSDKIRGKRKNESKKKKEIQRKFTWIE